VNKTIEGAVSTAAAIAALAGASALPAHAGTTPSVSIIGSCSSAFEGHATCTATGTASYASSVTAIVNSTHQRGVTVRYSMVCRNAAGTYHVSGQRSGITTPYAQAFSTGGYPGKPPIVCVVAVNAQLQGSDKERVSVTLRA
jgi:hypothetical protein